LPARHTVRLKTSAGGGADARWCNVPTQVVVVNDDHQLSSLLEQALLGDPRLEVVGKARTPLGAVALAWELVPQAIVVEQHDVGIVWWDTVPLLRRYCPQACLAVLTDLADDQLPPEASLADHVLPRHIGWQRLADLLAPPVCADEADEPLRQAQ